MIVIPPCPGIAEPECGQQVQRCYIWAVIRSRNAKEDILRIDFGILYNDIKIAIPGKGAGIDQFIFRLLTSTTAILCHQFSVRESALRILIQRIHKGMCRGIVKKVVILLYILTVVAL